MLHEAISEISGQEIPEVNDTQIDLPINAFIPATWILNREEKLEAYKSVTECSNNDELTELATDWVNRYGNLPKPVESLIMIMRLKLLAKKCGFDKIKLKKPNILIETKLKNSTFKILKNSLTSSVQNKFNFKEGEQLSTITIRGLGATEIQNQILLSSEEKIIYEREIIKKIKDGNTHKDIFNIKDIPIVNDDD